MAHKLTQFDIDMRTLAVAENMARKHSEVFTVLKTVLQVCNGEQLVSVAAAQVERIMHDYPTMVRWGDTYLVMLKSAKLRAKWQEDSRWMHEKPWDALSDEFLELVSYAAPLPANPDTPKSTAVSQVPERDPSGPPSSPDDMQGLDIPEPPAISQWSTGISVTSSTLLPTPAPLFTTSTEPEEVVEFKERVAGVGDSDGEGSGESAAKKLRLSSSSSSAIPMEASSLVSTDLLGIEIPDAVTSPNILTAPATTLETVSPKLPASAAATGRILDPLFAAAELTRRPKGPPAAILGLLQPWPLGFSPPPKVNVRAPPTR